MKKIAKSVRILSIRKLKSIEIRNFGVKYKFRDKNSKTINNINYCIFSQVNDVALMEKFGQINNPDIKVVIDSVIE